MRAKTPIVIGVFEDRLEAERAVDELEHSGFSHSDVGFALRGSDVGFGGMVTDAVGTKDGKGAVAGALTGGLVGGILGTATMMLLPGVGHMVLAGALLTGLGYAGAGVAIGGILGAMTGAEISEEEAAYYEKAFNDGKALVTVRSSDRDDQAIAIIRKHGGYETRANAPTLKV